MDTEKVYQQIYNCMRYAIAKELINGLNMSGINYAIVKGCPLAYYKTGKAGTRVSSDIDILISRQDIAKVEKILADSGFQSMYNTDRKERIMVVSNSHQLPPFYKKMGKFCAWIDVNFDLFWGEYTGKRIDVREFISDTVEMEIYGCKIKTLPPLKTLIQLILHHYKDMNSLYHLTGHVAIKKRLLEDVYFLCKNFPNEISVNSLYEACCRYEILPYAYYMFYYARKVYADNLLDTYLEALWTVEGEALLDCYGLAEQELKKWEISFEERLDRDVSAFVYSRMNENDREKLERNRRIFG